MPDGDNALREEVEKVRERTRLQALAQGMSPGDADTRAAEAVAEFCGRWGIKPEMLANAAPKLVRTQPNVRPRSPSAGFFDSSAPLPPPTPEPSRAVDLGSSPLRSLSSPGNADKTQSIRIGDLLRKGGAGFPPPPTPPAPMTAPGTSAGAPLSSFLQRVRSRSLADGPSAAAPPAPAPSPVPAPAPVAGPPRAKAPTPPTIQIRNIPVHDQVSMTPVPQGRTLAPPSSLPPGAPGGAVERRRLILEEFDRTYAEVQSMLEKRIGMDGVALGREEGGAADAPPTGITSDEALAMTQDLSRLMDGLQQMMVLCQGLLEQVEAGRARAGGPPSGA